MVSLGPVMRSAIIWKAGEDLSLIRNPATPKVRRTGTAQIHPGGKTFRILEKKPGEPPAFAKAGAALGGSCSGATTLLCGGAGATGFTASRVAGAAAHEKMARSSATLSVLNPRCVSIENSW